VIRKAGSTGATTAVSPNVCPVATTPTSRGGPLGPDGGGVLWDEPVAEVGLDVGSSVCSSSLAGVGFDEDVEYLADGALLGDGFS